MLNQAKNRWLLILLTLAVVASSLNFSAAAINKNLEAGAVPAAWAGDLSPITKADWNY